jgi:hypothetical protein
MMAKVPPPKGKGEPPSVTATLGNLERPEAAHLVPLNFKVPSAFKKTFKTYAAQKGKSMSWVLQEAFAVLSAQRSPEPKE